MANAVQLFALFLESMVVHQIVRTQTNQANMPRLPESSSPLSISSLEGGRMLDNGELKADIEAENVTIQRLQLIFADYISHVRRVYVRPLHNRLSTPPHKSKSVKLLYKTFACVIIFALLNLVYMWCNEARSVTITIEKDGLLGSGGQPFLSQGVNPQQFYNAKLLSLDGIDVDLMQVQMLDFLNGEWSHAEELVQQKYTNRRAFGGSLGFDLVRIWNLVNAATQHIRKNPAKDRKDFTELAQRTRALYISYRLLFDVPEPLFARIATITITDVPYNLNQREAVDSLFDSLSQTVEELTEELFPWITPPFNTIREMHSAAEEAKESVGLVLTGGSRHFYMLSHLILSLRREWNISLPVEVFYAGPGDMNEEMVASLNTIPGVKALDLTKFFPERTKGMGGWSVKPYAMLASSFQTVLFVDADVLFFQSPLLALESSAYRETGLLFFQDRFYRDETSQNTPKLFNRMNRHVSNYAKSMRFTNALTWDLTAGTYKMDSGFVVMDKGRLGNLFALLLTAKMNTWPEVETLHAETYGDKESFFFATEALRTPYKFNPGYGGALGHEEPTENPDFGRVCGIYLLQLDENENLFWWNGGGVLVDRYRTSNFSGEAWARFSQVGLDVDGLGTIWKDFCIVRPKNNVRNLTDTEQALLERYRDIFRKDLEGLGLKP